MSGGAHKYLDEHSQQAEYQARFRYKEAPRISDSAEQVSMGQLGHMLDTLKDAILCMQHLGIEPQLDVQTDRVYRHADDAVQMPPYVRALASNMLTASSFNRTDTGRVQEIKSYPDLTAFMNTLHGMMRKQSLEIGKSFIVPESVKDVVARYDAAIETYKGLLKQYADPDGKLNYRNIPDETMRDYAKLFEPIADDLAAKMKALPSIEVEIDGKRHTIKNDTLVNDRLHDTYPALVFFAYRTLGSGAADANKRPIKLEYEARQRKLIGAQSMITDTMQGLFDIAKKQGFAWDDIDREKFKNTVAQYVPSFQALLDFCRTADCGYPILYEDLERFIRMGGGTPAMHQPESPYEAALMLYAVERRFARTGDKDPALQAKLRHYADEVATCMDIEQVKERFGRDVQFKWTLMRSRSLAANGMESALPALDQLLPLINLELSAGQRINRRDTGTGQQASF